MAISETHVEGLPERLASFGDASTRAAFARHIDVPARAACLLVAALGFFLPEIARRPEVQWAPWLLSLVLLGLPHGGIDPEIPGLLSASQKDSKQKLLFYTGYLSLMAAMLLLWRLSPSLGLSVFLLSSAYHFGQGDLYWSSAHGYIHWLRKMEGAGRSGRLLYQGLFLAVRGAMPVFWPLLVFIEQYQEIGRGLAEELSRPGMAPLEWAGEHRNYLLLALGLSIGAQAAFQFGLARKHRGMGRPQGAAGEIFEMISLLLLFTFAPPVLATGTYFIAWHSARHVGRLMLLADPSKSAVLNGETARGLIGFHRRALPLTGVAAALLLLLAAALYRNDLSRAQVVTPVFLFVSAITLPHLALVLWMDHAQRIWRGQSRS